MPAKFWTEELDARLSDLWKTEASKDAILNVFPKQTWAALYCRASELGIPRLPNGRGLPEQHLHMEPKVSAYIAGLLDGEGYIILKPAGQSRRYHGKIGITNTHLGALEYVKKMTGMGDVRFIHRMGYRNVYEWEIQAKSDLFNFLNCVIGYQIIKQKQATVMLQWVHHRSQTAVYNRSAGLDVEKELYLSLREMNFRGPTSPIPPSASEGL